MLGITWDKDTDMLSINPEILNIEHVYSEVITKRLVLSIANRIYDPIGFSCPASLLPKVILRSLWENKVAWDVSIDRKQAEIFKQWMIELPRLKEIQIPRSLSAGTLELHTFGDASGSAYAAVVFARIVQNDNVVNVQLLSARSRVAPKEATIPRLELMAATIATRLTRSVIDSLTRSIENITFWSDSTTILAWIDRDLQWGTFVHNRVKEIRSMTKGCTWRFIPGKYNPADLPSRGCSPAQLLDSKWWRGPQWLYGPELSWPLEDGNLDEQEVMSEMKKGTVTQMVNVSSSFKFERFFATYTKIVRFIALSRIFFDKCRARMEEKRNLAINQLEKDKKFSTSSLEKKTTKMNLNLTCKQIRDAETKLLLFLQKQMFNHSDKLTSFKTMVNADGLYILKTKILNRRDDVNFLCPIILDGNHEIVYLLVREVHEKLGHVGTQIMMNNLRERFWIIGLRRVAKWVLSKCVVCKKQKVKYLQSEAPSLPLERVRDARIFEVTGIDLAGPIYFRGGGKGWICLFTCAVYRAVHLELVSSLSTESFLQALRRFISRRGRPMTIYSDNATNFSGANNAFEALDWEKIMKHSSASQIEWYFIPPSAPWWGGWWERLIGVMKSILRKVLGKASLSYEALSTVLCEAEAIINSRPLTYISEDPDDLKPLSPSCFLQEIQEIGTPDIDMFYHDKLNRKFKYLQQLVDALRKRFRIEYLGQLILKDNKKENRKLRVGDVVLVGDNIHKRTDWPLARIVDIILGKDGHIRVVIVDQ